MVVLTEKLKGRLKTWKQVFRRPFYLVCHNLQISLGVCFQRYSGLKLIHYIVQIVA
ncbi:hypothetical protein HMPREF1051_0600 [Neisseria sicca VK64]|uniref:Uncharacterized protein n=1 Tax=Neisseria sicca VK64 TaxID=1095748 RepID=I2NQ64_NEISI|nr:hypothetical protein HMPREF1051_0600 [Neisseria sicca VK64]